MLLFFNEYAGFKVIYVYGRFMGVPLQLKTRLHCDVFTRTKRIII